MVAPCCHLFLNQELVCLYKLKFSLSLSLSVSLRLSLSFHAVAREAGRMRSLAAAEGHGEKTGLRRNYGVFIENVCNV